MKRYICMAWILGWGLVPAVWAQVDFTRFYVIGDSLTAGFSHGALNELFQQYSYPALIAAQVGNTDFQQPLVSDPGIPPRLKLFSIFPQTVIQPVPGLGTPTNLRLPRPYNNLAVPGATTADVMNTVSSETNPLFDVVLRGLGTQFQQLVASQPTFVIVWIGNNDLLAGVLAATIIENVTVTPLSVFVNQFSTLINGLRTLLPNTKVLVINLPDATKTPFAATIPPCVPDPVTRQCVLVNGAPIPLLGTRGPIPQDALVTLAASSLIAQGYGIPKNLGGNGQPLPDDVVLYPDEIAAYRSLLDAYNEKIADIARNAGYEVFDFRTIFDAIAEHGYPVGGVELTGRYLLGGLFSYDAIHPTPLGYAVLANEIIRFLNLKMGADIEMIDLLPFITGEKGAYPSGDTGVGGATVVYSQQAHAQMLRLFAPKYWRRIHSGDAVQ